MLFNGSAQAVLVPGAEGDFQVLSDHAPVMTAMRPGVVGIDDAEGKHRRVFVRGGFADASKKGLILLAETAIPFEDFDADKLGQEIKNAEEDLADASEDQKRSGPREARPLARAQGRNEALAASGARWLPRSASPRSLHDPRRL